jgi:hypothetical protein
LPSIEKNISKLKKDKTFWNSPIAPKGIRKRLGLKNYLEIFVKHPTRTWQSLYTEWGYVKRTFAKIDNLIETEKRALKELENEHYEDVPVLPKFYFQLKNIQDMFQLIDNTDLYKNFIIFREGLIKCEPDEPTVDPFDEQLYLLFRAEIFRKCRETVLRQNPKFALIFMGKCIGDLRCIYKSLIQKH